MLLQQNGYMGQRDKMLQIYKYLTIKGDKNPIGPSGCVE